jgi:glycosyltransferase involved in cell wall biosynthesis
MRIAFDVSDLCTARADGTTRYTYELAKRMPEILPETMWHFHAPCIQNPNLEFPNAEWIITPWPKYWTQLRLPLALYQKPADVLFMPIQQLPYIHPRMKTVAVIHDLAIHKYPEQFTYKDWLLLHTFSAHAARQADEIIAVSQSTADDIAQYYGRTENVHIIHHGVDHNNFRVPTDVERTSSWQALQTQYPQIQKPYILYVGQIQPRKNLIKLVEAFELIRQKNKDLQLVIAGGHGWLQQPILDRIESSPERFNILLTGRVPEELLVPLYWHAEVFALPSLYEGFGMPILEALAAGCPVVASNISSMPEVLGDAGILIDPQSAESLAAGIMEAQSQSDMLRAKGLVRVKHFSWDLTAEATAKLLSANL